MNSKKEQFILIHLGLIPQFLFAYLIGINRYSLQSSAKKVYHCKGI